MKLTNKEKQTIGKLRKLDVVQRDRLLARIERTLIANQIAERTGKIKRLKPAADHRVIRAYGHVPSWKPGRKKDQ